MYRDMNPELSAWESGLDRFVRLDKGEFIGRAALVRERGRGIARRLATVAIDTDGASALIHEAVYHRDRLVGRITSGGYAYTLGHDVALALLPVELAAPGTELEVLILGERRQAHVIPDSPYDPDAARARM